MKRKFTIVEQVQHMKQKGIEFNIIDEDNATSFLTNNTYYFKIKAYSKNYKKNSSLKYTNLEFAFLKELSILDMHLRRSILHLTLNLEHAIRVLINTHFSSNALEDGYSIVDAFNSELAKQNYKSERHHSLYTKDLYEKYADSAALWNYMELLSFGELTKFFEYYFKLYDLSLYNMKSFLFPITRLRNAAAHNNCLLINLIDPKINPTYKIKNILKKSFSDNTINSALSIPVINDFAVLLYCFRIFVKSDIIVERSFLELSELVKRFNKNISFFNKNQKLKNNIIFFSKLVDFFKP